MHIISLLIVLKPNEALNQLQRIRGPKQVSHQHTFSSQGPWKRVYEIPLQTTHVDLTYSQPMLCFTFLYEPRRFYPVNLNTWRIIANTYFTDQQTHSILHNPILRRKRS